MWLHLRRSMRVPQAVRGVSKRLLSGGYGVSSLRPVHQIRESFLQFFEEAGHVRLPSASLVPQNDDTLLFTNSGMVPFKDYFTGAATAPAPRVTTAQRCMRAGGKHNDLDNVGRTPRHHTFFEMLGNFSFGAYFKEEAIFLAWKYLTQTLELPEARLRVSMLYEDDESAVLWRKIAGLSEAGGRVVRKGPEENFWSMGRGEVPCGPCTEVFWDHGDHIAEEDDRFLEIWNLVFMQHLSGADNELQPLPVPCVDTGMGLERMACVLQGCASTFDTDVFLPLLHAIQTARPPTRQRALDATSLQSCLGVCSPEDATVCCQVIADHLRAAAWLVADGVVPSNNGRGYVLRRLVRRAVCFATQLGVEDPLLGGLVTPLAESLGDAHTHLQRTEALQHVRHVLDNEEQAFMKTLRPGFALLRKSLCEGTGASTGVLSGDVAFRLFDTHGFPLDLTQLLLRSRGLTVDTAGFDECMRLQRETARAAAAGTAVGTASTGPDAATVAELRRQLEAAPPPEVATEPEVNARVLATVSAGGDEAWCVVSPCPFHPEGGGQSADRGALLCGDLHLDVRACVTLPDITGPHTLLLVALDTLQLRRGDAVLASVCELSHRRSAAHHTSTHLLHAALRRFVGPQVTQAGSAVDARRLRFDFTSAQPTPPATLRAVEGWLDEIALSAAPVTVDTMPLQEALAAPTAALAQFGEAYDESCARVVRVGEVSTELCCGSHAASTLACFPFKILSEHSIASGVRRIEAVAGERAAEWLGQQFAVARATASELVPARALSDGTAITSLSTHARQLAEQTRALEAENTLLKRQYVLGPWEGEACVNEYTRELESGRGSVPLVVRVVPPRFDMDNKAWKQLMTEAHASADAQGLRVLVCGASGRCVVFGSEEWPADEALQQLGRSEFRTTGGATAARVTAVGRGSRAVAQGRLTVSTGTLEDWLQATGTAWVLEDKQ